MREYNARPAPMVSGRIEHVQMAVREATGDLVADGVDVPVAGLHAAADGRVIAGRRA
jgi:hypothetical protein